VKRMVETGVGVGVLYESSVHREIEEGRLCRLNVTEVDLSVTYYLGRPEHHPQTPAAQHFSHFMREYFAVHAPAC